MASQLLKYVISQKKQGKVYHLLAKNENKTTWTTREDDALQYPTRGQAEYAAVKRNINEWFITPIRIPLKSHRSYSNL